MILAVDPGLATCGWSVLDDRGRVQDLGAILTERDATIDESTDRARRVDQQAQKLGEVARRHNVRMIGCEAMSFGGPPAARFHMAISVGLSWGVVAGVARTLGLALYSVAPKLWQRAAQPGAGKRVNYDKLEKALDAYVAGQGPRAIASLAVIAKSNRNHALDAVGIGVFVALRREQADRIVNERAAARSQLYPTEAT